MRLTLNRWQRATIIGIAGLILVILYVQIEEVGLYDSPWLIAVLVVGGLFFVAVSPNRSSVSLKSNLTPEMFSKEDEGEATVRQKFQEASGQWTDFLKGSLADRLPSLSRETRSDFGAHIQTIGVKLAYGVYLLVISRRYPEASEGPDAKALKLAAGGLLTRAIHEDFHRMKMPEGTRDKALQAAAREVVEVERAIAKAKQDFASSGPFPMDALWLLVEKQLPLGLKTPADREAFFGIKLRQEIGRLLL